MNKKKHFGSVKKLRSQAVFVSFDIDNPQERNQAVSASIGLSFNHLKKDARYGRQQVN